MTLTFGLLTPKTIQCNCLLLNTKNHSVKFEGSGTQIVIALRPSYKYSTPPEAKHVPKYNSNLKFWLKVSEKVACSPK